MASKGDTFNGMGWPDPHKWQALDPSNGGEKYGHTDEFACHLYSSDQTRLDGHDSLVITAARIKAGEKWWRSGFLNSRGAKFFYPLYGTFKVMATLPQASGIWPAIWMRAANGGANRAEVDIAEVFFAGGDQVSQHLHFPTTMGKSVWGHGMKLTKGVPHTYWVKIAPSGSNAVRFSLGVDSTVAGDYLHPDRARLLDGCDTNNFWDIALNLAVSDSKWTGSQVATTSPQVMKVDWVQWTP